MNLLFIYETREALKKSYKLSQYTNGNTFIVIVEVQWDSVYRYVPYIT